MAVAFVTKNKDLFTSFCIVVRRCDSEKVILLWWRC